MYRGQTHSNPDQCLGGPWDALPPCELNTRREIVNTRQLNRTGPVQFLATPTHCEGANTNYAELREGGRDKRQK